MKEYKIRLFSLNELSEDAVAKVCDKEREDVFNNYGTIAMESDAEERIGTLNWFCQLFGITYRIDYDHQYRFISWQFQDVEMNGYDWSDEDITGKYLLRWLNRYYYKIRSRKWNCIQSKVGMKFRYSKIRWTTGDCTFTGVCYDCDILEKIWDWYDKPNWTISLHDLFDDCFHHFMKLWEEEDEYRMSDEHISEAIFVNNPDALYFEDGTEFQGSADELEEYSTMSEEIA